MSRLTAAIRKAPQTPTDFLLLAVAASVAEAREQHPQPYVDPHHALGVLDEEVHEFRLEVYRKRIRPEQMQTELLQIAAVAIRAIEDLTLNLKTNGKGMSGKGIRNSHAQHSPATTP